MADRIFYYIGILTRVLIIAAMLVALALCYLVTSANDIIDFRYIHF